VAEKVLWKCVLQIFCNNVKIMLILRPGWCKGHDVMWRILVECSTGSGRCLISLRQKNSFSCVQGHNHFTRVIYGCHSCSMATYKHFHLSDTGLLGHAHFVATLEYFATGINFTYEMLINASMLKSFKV
jgi:hypothetical protein